MRQFAFSSRAVPAPQQQQVQPATPSLADMVAEINQLRRENDRLRMEREIFEYRGHLRGDGKMKFSFIQENCAAWPVRVMCSVLGIAVSDYYAWRSRTESKRAAANR